MKGTKQVSKPSYAAYFAIEKDLTNKGFDVERSELISMFTDERKSHLSDLTREEYQAFITWLAHKFGTAPKRSSYSGNQDKQLNQQRRKIIAMLCKIGFVKNDKADMVRIHAWVEKYGYLHIHLNHYERHSLPQLVTQVTKFYKSHIERMY